MFFRLGEFASFLPNFVEWFLRWSTCFWIEDHPQLGKWGSRLVDFDMVSGVACY